MSVQYVDKAGLTYTVGKVKALITATQALIPEDLADLNGDTTHRVVTDAEKTAWNAKQTALTEGTDYLNKTHLDAAYIAVSKAGAAGGIAQLDSNGKVPSSQLPSYVDDVVEYDSLSDFPATGESGKIYVAKDTNTCYRWSGSTYIAIASSLSLGETASTAYRGDRGKIAYDHSQDADVHVTAAQKTAWTAKYDKPSTGIPKADLVAAVQTSLGLADTAYQKASTGIPKADLAATVQASLGLADTALQSSYLVAVTNAEIDAMFA